jgi:hypothetical protein
MFNLNYAAEKFGTAIYSLIGTGSHQKRLHSAYSSFHVLRPDDFQSYPDLKDLYEEIMRRLTVVRDQPKEIGYVPATLAQMNDQEAAEIATKILDMYIMIQAERR